MIPHRVVKNPSKAVSISSSEGCNVLYAHTIQHIKSTPRIASYMYLRVLHVFLPLLYPSLPRE